MRLEPATTDVIGQGANNYATEMSKMIPITPVVAGSSLTHGILIMCFNSIRC